jgi:hypothetical protein
MATKKDPPVGKFFHSFRLASNHNGDVVAAIRRTLQGAGADLHNLCVVLGTVSVSEWRERVCCPDSGL